MSPPPRSSDPSSWDRIPELLGEIERLRAVLWARLRCGGGHLSERQRSVRYLVSWRERGRFVWERHMGTDILILLVQGWFFAAALMLFLWFIQRAKQDAGVVDFGWCASIGLLALYFAVASHGWPLRRCLVAALAVLWAGRLAVYLLVDRILGRPEDFRYRTVRERLGPRANRYFLLYFVGHSFLVLPFCIPLLVVMAHTRPELGIWEIVGLFLGVGAILGESIADQQLARFRARPGNRGRTCRQGLWRYSRHPNYFFEWLYWCSYPIIAVGAPRAWLALVGSFGILIPLFLLTGIPATEAQAVANRGEDYRAYQRSTSVFIPWFPGRE